MSADKQNGAALSSIQIRRGKYPELTWTAVLVGWVLGAVIAISIGYASLILGFSIEGSELAAIMGWGILRGIMGRTSILENNINQTIASAVNGASSGIMFSVPALFILSESMENPALTEFNVPLMVIGCIIGACLGLCFVIPLRKQMIDFDRLAYPGGIAVAAILKSPGAGLRKAMMMLFAAMISGVAHLIVLVVVGDDHLEVGEFFNFPSMLNVTFYLSLMTIGVGFLAGKNGFWFGAGGFICYFLLSPLLSVVAADDVAAIVTDPNEARTQLFRPTGIGMLIGAAIGGIICAFPLIISAFRSMHQAGKLKSADGSTSDEMPIRALYVAILAGALALIVIAFCSVKDMNLATAVPMALLGTLWVWMAGVIVSECVGRTNWSPLSGMTLIAVTILIFIANRSLDDTQTIVSSVIVGAAICLAISQASDMMLDLKSGYLVGAVPRRQQMAQFIGAWLGPIVVIGLVFVLHSQYGLGSDRLPAPQGQALASMIEGIVADNMPTYRYVAGAGLGAMLAFSGLGGIGVLIGLGFSMPFYIVLTYTIGTISRIVVDRVKGKRFSEVVGIPVAAGLIIGEALVGVGNAIYHVISAAMTSGAVT